MTKSLDYCKNPWIPGSDPKSLDNPGKPWMVGKYARLHSPDACILLVYIIYIYMHPARSIHTFTIIGIGFCHLITFSATTNIVTRDVGAHLLAGICSITLINIWGKNKKELVSYVSAEVMIAAATYWPNQKLKYD